MHAKNLIIYGKRLSFMLFLLLGVVWFSSINAQTISGKVLNKDQEALIGATILEVGTQNGTITNIDGEFSLTLTGDSKQIEIRYIGYNDVIKDVTGEEVITVELEDGIGLNEVVITALGISREKKSLGYAVTDVKGTEMLQARTPNAVNALNGKVAGLQIGNSASGAGGSNKIVLRGNSSLTGDNGVLYVVDGIPLDNSSNQSGSDSYGNNFDLGSGISDINPDDIESISVLKGPNAAALYGSRASNGVVLITTKSGSYGDKIGISFNSNYAVEAVAFMPEFQNKYGHGTNGETPNNQEDLKASSSWGPAMGSSGLLWTGENGSTSSQENNVSDFFDLGRSFTNSVGIDGGTDKASYRLSYTNLDYKGTLPGNEMKRNSVTLRGKADLTDRLTADTKVSYTNQNVANRPRLSGWGDNVALNLYVMPRSVSLSDLETAYEESNAEVIRPTSAYGNNPYHIINETGSADTRDRVYGFASLQYKLTDNLSALVRAGHDYSNQAFEYFAPANHPFLAGGRYEKKMYANQESNYDFLLSYNNNLTTDLDFGINLGGNVRKNKSTIDGYEGTGLVTDKIYNVTNLSAPAIIEGAGTYEKQVNSLYASGQFGFQRMLYLDWSARNDWSSTLPADNRSYFYPSVSLSAVLSEMLNVNAIDFLKARVSFAQVGNDTRPYQLIESFSSSNTYNGVGLASPTYLGNVIFRVPSTKANPNLKPERTTSMEAGLEFNILSNRLGGDISWYNNDTKDQIISVPVPVTSGYSLLFLNAGSVSNTGIELGLNYDIIKNDNFNWNLGITYARNRTFVKELFPEEGINELILYNNLNLSNFVIKAISENAEGADAGKGYAQIWGSDYVYDDSGKIVVNDAGLPIASESKYLGKVDPDWIGSLYSKMTFKNFGFNFLINTIQGGSIVSMTQNQMDLVGTSTHSAEDLYRNGTFVVPNSTMESEANTVEVTGEDYFGAVSNITSNYVNDGSFIKLKEVSLSYNIASKNSILNDASISVFGRNLFFLQNKAEGFDPEAAAFNSGNGANGVEFFSLPGTRTYGVNLSIKL